MSTGPTDAELIRTKRNEAIAAAEAGDYDTAIVKLTSALTVLVTTPDGSDAVGSISYDRDQLEGLLDNYRRLRNEQASATGLRKMKFQFCPNDPYDRNVCRG